MRKNKMMRTAAVLSVATLLTASVLSGTFAKYTTSVDGTDTARVAKWGFTEDGTTITLDKLFANAYKTDGTTADSGDTATVKTTANKTDIIAPGTTGSATFGFTYGGATGVTAPEVEYTFEVDTTGSSYADALAKDTNIQWKLDDKSWGTWAQMLTDIQALDGNKTDNKYNPGELPAAFNKTSTDADANKNLHTVSWRWLFDEKSETNGTNLDTKDTELGNAASLAEVKLVIKITATQVD